MAEDKPVRRVGDYEFLDRIAVGGMGELWRVRHVTLGAIYCAKQLRTEYREDPEFLKRFLHEARLVANLRHPNIVQVFGYDQENTLYLMEYVKGVDLDHLLRSTRILDFADKRTVIEAVADTIGYAHREIDLIHRDIKPSNVLIAINTVHDPIKRTSIKLTDFGIARLLNTNQRMTMSSGMVMGTLHYMAPEQFEGEADKYSDVYSIGVLYYQLLTGTIPFDGPTAFVIRDKHVSEVPPAPHELKPDVPFEDSVIVMKCLEKDPARRFQDAADLYDELMSTGTGAGPHPPRRAARFDATQPIDATQVLDTGQAPAKTQTEETLLTGGNVRAASVPPAMATPAPGTMTPSSLRPADGISGPPTAATMAPPAQTETEQTLRVKITPPRRKRLIRSVLVAIVVLVVAGLAATQLLKPKYELRWDTLRSDPLDTPNGIEVSVSPKIAFGTFWMDAGTIGDEAPPNWADWTTWFGSIDVKLSDGLYREYVITCERGDCAAGNPLPGYDFGGATFEQLAQARKAEVAEDLAKVGLYVNAMLAPKGLATAQSLDDVRRCLVRVTDLLDRAKDVQADRSRLEAYRGIVGGLVEAAEALADGHCDAAEAKLAEAEKAIGTIDLGGLASLPDDFLFRQSLATAVAQAKARAGRAERFVESLEPVSGSSRDVSYTVSKCKAARDAVAEDLLGVPGRAGYRAVLTAAGDGKRDIARVLEDLGDVVPPPFRTVLAYVGKLDAVVDHKADPSQETLYRVEVLKLLEGAVGAPKAEAAPWVAKCFEAGQLADRRAVLRLWTQIHRSRFARAATAVRGLAEQRAVKAAAPSTSAADACMLLAGAEDCLHALRDATLASDEERRAATALSSTCAVRHAMGLFNRGQKAGETAGDHVAAVRKLLDRGLDELAGCAPDVEKQGRALRDILKFVGGASARLDAARRENFPNADTFRGRLETLFAALEAQQSLSQELAKHAGHPCAGAALGPFTRLDADVCRGYSLANAAACWLLAQAAEQTEKEKYADAARTLGAFQRGTGNGESPLKALLAPPLLQHAGALARIAAAFDDSAIAAGAKDRWRRVWDQRLKAKPDLDVTLPERVDPASLPEGSRGEAEQWTAITARMRGLVAHYKQQADAEEAVRAVETRAAKLLVREGGTVKPNPATATPAAIGECVAAFQKLEAAALARHGDQPARLAALQRDLGAITTIRTDHTKQIRTLIAKPDPKAALDAIAATAAVLGMPAERDLTGDAVAAARKPIDAAIEAAEYDQALALMGTIAKHKQVTRHAADQAVAAALRALTAAGAYCEAQRALARGAEGFEAALPHLRSAGDFRDAKAIAQQIGPFLEATKLQKTAPFKAWARCSDLLKSPALSRTMKDAAKKAESQIRDSLAKQAVGCTQAFAQALTTGGWEGYIGRGVNAQEEIQRVRAFLARADKLAIEDGGIVGQPSLVPDSREVRVTTKRIVKFVYKLPGGATLPVALDQKIEWTVRHVPPSERKDREWVVESWEVAY